LRKIIITGPESSGKTTLARDLANHFNVEFVPEFARDYLQKIGRHYTFEDVVNIGEAQNQSEKLASESYSDLLICDTDLLTIKIWLEFKYGRNDEWVESKISRYKNRVYLLCAPDMEWEDDELRENPDDRQELFEIYKDNLEYLNLEYHVLEGSKKYRLRESISIIESL
jgi:NadR type nicotinamide-nucleotide adenylyltransferase